jgi:hypothetical protein
MWHFERVLEWENNYNPTITVYRGRKKFLLAILTETTTKVATAFASEVSRAITCNVKKLISVYFKASDD